jgi:predicted double-glycine peptidase
MNIKHIFSNNYLVIQKGQSSCGPAALLNVLHLKDDFSHTEAELAQLCDAKVGYGTTTKNLVKAAKQVGLEVIEEKSNGTVEDIQRTIDAGACVVICYTNAYSGNSHYTVVTEYDDRALYCRDSAFGFFRFSKEYLEKSWHGVAHDASRDNKQWYMVVT